MRPRPHESPLPEVVPRRSITWSSRPSGQTDIRTKALEGPDKIPVACSFPSSSHRQSFLVVAPTPSSARAHASPPATSVRPCLSPTHGDTKSNQAQATCVSTATILCILKWQSCSPFASSRISLLSPPPPPSPPPRDALASSSSFCCCAPLTSSSRSSPRWPTQCQTQ